MYEAMIAIDSAAIVVWFRPTMMVLRAIGICTLVSRCQPVWPTESVASIVVVDTALPPGGSPAEIDAVVRSRAAQGLPMYELDRAALAASDAALAGLLGSVPALSPA